MRENGNLIVKTLFEYYKLDVEINRVELIDENGRSYVNKGLHEVELSIQDRGKTLKIFISKEKEDE